MKQPLTAQELYPAGVAGVTTRRLTLATGVSLRIAETGPPNGDPLVLLHGWAASLYMYRHPLEHLSKCGFRIIAPDLRGFGLSDKPDSPGAYSLEAYLDDTRALLDALHLDRASLVGQSMGGGIALHFALRWPARVIGLGLINPTGLAPVSYLSVLRLAPREIVSALGRAVVPRLFVEFILRRMAYCDASLVTERVIDEYWSPTQLPGFVRAARAALDEFQWEPVSEEVILGLTVPTVVILGSQDRLVPGARAAAERLPGAKVHVMDSGHCVHEEHPREVYDAIIDFLREVDSGPRKTAAGP